MIMRVAAPKAFAFARIATVTTKNTNAISFTALRMMSVAMPSTKVCYT
jgi:hypothetical protein